MKKTTIFVFAVALCSASLRAQEPKSIMWHGDTFPFEGPAQDAPAALQKIFSNLGPSTSAYSLAGWAVWGPNYGYTQFIAMPFTPKANAHVQQVRAAVQYTSSGANQVNLSLYSDAGGMPGVLLAGPVTVKNVPVWPSCCKLAIATFTTGVPITAGTRYWVVADTPTTGTGSDFSGGWNWVPPSKLLFGIDQGGGWSSTQAYIEEPAGAVYGTIP